MRRTQAKPAPGKQITIEKHWDGNERVTEGRNGRLRVSQGRWQWVVIVNGVWDQQFDFRHEARRFVKTLEAR